jgi:hypothetical protein
VSELLRDVEGFLEKQEYRIKQSTNRYTTGVKTYFDVYYSNGEDVIAYGETPQEACEFALDHFLKNNFIFHWRKAVASNQVEALIPLVYVEDIKAEILQAIDYLEKLEKGE